MSAYKTEKELAFLYDLYVATDWGERFAEIVDEHVELPEKGRVLYLASGTGLRSASARVKTLTSSALTRARNVWKLHARRPRRQRARTSSSGTRSLKT